MAKVDETIIEEPKKLNTTDGVSGFKEGQVLIPGVNTIEEKPAVIEPTPIEEPIVEETKIEPTPVVEPVKVEETKIEPTPIVEPTKIEETPVIDKEQEKQNAITEFSSMIETGANTKDIAEFVNSNLEYKKNFNGILKTNLKNTANTKYYGKYASMSNESLLSEINAGNVVIGSEQYNLLPETKRTSIEAYKKQVEATTINDKTDFTTGDNITSLDGLLSEVKNLYSFNLRDEYEKLLNSDEIKGLAVQLGDKKAEIEKYDIEIEDQEENLRKELAGNLPGAIQAAVNDANRDSIKEKRLKLAEYNALLGTYQTLKSDAQTELEYLKYEDAQNKAMYDTALGLYESRRAERISSESAITQRSYDLADIEQKRKWALEDQEFEQKSNELAENRERAWELEMTEIDQQFSLDNKSGTYQTDRDGNLLYVVNGEATKVKDNTGTVVGIKKENDYTDTITKNEDGGYDVLRTYDDKNKKPDFFSYGVNGTSNNNTSIVVWDNLSGISDSGLWCGEAVNKYLTAAGITDIWVGDTYESKSKYIDSQTPQVGGLAVWNPSQNGKYGENGHIGVVTGYNPSEGTVQITDWNSKGDKTKQTYTIPVSQINNSDGGFVTLSTTTDTGIDTTTKEYTLANSIFKGTSKLSDFTATNKADIVPVLDKIIEENLTDDEDRNLIVKSASSTKDISESTLETFSDMATVKYQLGKIEETLEGKDTGPIMGILEGKNPYDAESQLAMAQLAGLTPKVARGIFGEVGVLTDTDIANYQKALPNLKSTAEKNQLVIDFMEDLLATGFKNTIEAQAKGRRNVSSFLGDYDEVMEILNAKKIETEQEETPIVPVVNNTGYNDYLEFRKNTSFDDTKY